MKLRTVFLLLFFMVSCDQLTKGLILDRYMSVEFDILPPLLRFSPVFDTTYAYDRVHYPSSIFVENMHIFFPTIFILLFIFYRFAHIIFGEYRIIHYGFLLLMTVLICNYMDLTLWKGNLQYLHLYTFAKFNLKDIYSVCILLFAAKLVYTVYRLDNKD
ncbi:hypothetical protein M2135_002128 [Parabacteroides sp. PF5-9]|nr:hypothetical protein [Parabacteroides sp. PF5-9]